MTGNALWVFPGPVLVHYGAKLNLLIDQQPHQWWRFVTPMFLHVNLVHVLVNMYSLWMIGPYVEKLYGSAKFVFFWVVTGIAGVIASYLTVVNPDTHLGAVGRYIFKTQDAPSAGASGALFGLIGVLFVFGIKFRNELPEGFKRAFGTGLLPVIMINLFIGFMGRGFIDNAAHLGGMISGAALALVISYRRPGERSNMALVWQVLQVASLALVVFSFARVAQHFNDPTPLDQRSEAQPVAPSGKPLEFLRFAKAMNDGQEVFLNALKGDHSGIEASIAALEAAIAPDLKSDQLRRKLEALLQRAKQLAPPKDVFTAQDPHYQALADFESWKKEYDSWVKTSAKDYEG